MKKIITLLVLALTLGTNAQTVTHTYINGSNTPLPASTNIGNANTATINIYYGDLDARGKTLVLGIGKFILYGNMLTDNLTLIKSIPVTTGGSRVIPSACVRGTVNGGSTIDNGTLFEVNQLTDCATTCPTLMNGSTLTTIFLSTASEMVGSNNKEVNVGTSLYEITLVSNTNGFYNYKLTLSSGQPLVANTNGMVSILGCEYPISVLSTPKFDVTVDYGYDYTVYNFTGQIIEKGITDENTSRGLPKNTPFILSVVGFKPVKMFVLE